MDEEILQPEEIKVTDPVTDPDTGEYTDETTVEIKPEVTAPSAITLTLGELKLQLQEVIDTKASFEIGYQEGIKYYDGEIARLDNLIKQIQ